jgi:regulatory protein
LRALSQREHSRSELANKLARALPEVEAGDPVLTGLLDSLAARGLQSDERTAEALVAAKSARWGERRLRAELQRRGLAAALVEQNLAPLRDSELERARALWHKRFGEAPASSPAEKARQMRYLAGRGFAPALIARLLRGVDDDAE